MNLGNRFKNLRTDLRLSLRIGTGLGIDCRIHFRTDLKIDSGIGFKSDLRIHFRIDLRIHFRVYRIYLAIVFRTDLGINFRVHLIMAKENPRRGGPHSEMKYSGIERDAKKSGANFSQSAATL